MTKDKEKYYSKEYQYGTKVTWGKAADRQLARVPEFVREKFQAWVTLLVLVGLREVRRRPGFHDEPLKGQRQGQRSIRLSRGYRAIYIEHDGAVHLVEVIEVSKHDY